MRGEEWKKKQTALWRCLLCRQLLFNGDASHKLSYHLFFCFFLFYSPLCPDDLMRKKCLFHFKFSAPQHFKRLATSNIYSRVSPSNYLILPHHLFFFPFFDWPPNVVHLSGSVTSYLQQVQSSLFCAKENQFFLFRTLFNDREKQFFGLNI